MKPKLRDIFDVMVIMCALISAWAWFLTGLQMETVLKIQKEQYEIHNGKIKEYQSIINHYFLNDD